MQHKSFGFTLIELMIVVAIVAILASLAMTIYEQSIGKAQLSEAFTVTDGLRKDVVEYTSQYGACPTASSNGFLPAGSYSGRYVASATLDTSGSNCVIDVLMGTTGVASALRGKQVVFTLTSQNGSSNWACSSNADPAYIPNACQ